MIMLALAILLLLEKKYQMYFYDLDCLVCLFCSFVLLTSHLQNHQFVFFNNLLHIARLVLSLLDFLRALHSFLFLLLAHSPTILTQKQ